MTQKYRKIMNQIAYDNTTEQGTRTIEYIPQGVCSRLIKIEIDASKTIVGVAYFMGCSGNTQGIQLAQALKNFL